MVNSLRPLRFTAFFALQLYSPILINQRIPLQWQATVDARTKAVAQSSQ
jgi:hypothetical protein